MNDPAVSAKILRSPNLLRRFLRGLSLIELMVAMAVLAVLFVLVMGMMSRALQGWRQGERLQDASDRAMSALDIIASDLRSAAVPSGETLPNGGPVVQVQVRIQSTDGNSRVLIVRTIEAGEERAFTRTAGDGIDNPSIETQSPFSRRSMRFSKMYDNENFDMLDDDDDSAIDEDLKPLGGLMAVAYFTENGTLYRAQRSPVPPNLSLDEMCRPLQAQVVARNVLFFAVDCWTPFTGSNNWDGDLPRNLSASERRASNFGSETQWDSTRGILGSSDFCLAVGRDSFRDLTDDVFPTRVRITLTCDLPGPRSIGTTLDENIGSSAMNIRTGDLRGFPPGGTDDSFVLIGSEWVRFESRTGNVLTLQDGYDRGARGTVAQSHPAGTPVRAGVQRVYIVELSQYRAYRRGRIGEELGSSR